MAKRNKKKTSYVLAYDLGGTKVEAGVISSDGKVLKSIRTSVIHENGPTGLIQQLLEIGKNFREQYPAIQAIGMGSAGPLDPARGLLLDPTNMKTQGEAWGKVDLKKPFEKTFRIPFCLNNDAAAAVLAEKWKGSAQKNQNAMVLTLGTGLGTGMICNGELVRSGRGLHPEGGHVLLHAGDPTALCGCGLYGCAEAYLSGKNFENRFRRKNPSLKWDAKEIAEQARSGSSPALAAFAEYSENLAYAITTYVVLYSPERVILTGSFASAADCFLPELEARLPEFLKRRRVGVDLLPRVLVSKLQNQAGLLGAAYGALHRQPN